jgi:hypothetical protein
LHKYYVATNLHPPSPGVAPQLLSTFTNQGELTMCDYSLHGIQNRLAEKNEVLVVHRFCTGSKGLTSPEYLEPPKRKGLWALLTGVYPTQTRACAVCIPDGASLVLHGISADLQNTFGLSDTQTVTFRQLSVDIQTYRDAVEFENGVHVRLQDLEEGQRVDVLALSSDGTDVDAERLRTVAI